MTYCNVLNKNYFLLEKIVATSEFYTAIFIFIYFFYFGALDNELYGRSFNKT